MDQFVVRPDGRGLEVRLHLSLASPLWVRLPLLITTDASGLQDKINISRAARQSRNSCVARMRTRESVDIAKLRQALDDTRAVALRLHLGPLSLFREYRPTLKLEATMTTTATFGT